MIKQKVREIEELGYILEMEATRTWCSIRRGQLEIFRKSLSTNSDTSLTYATCQLCDHTWIASSIWGFQYLIFQNELIRLFAYLTHRLQKELNEVIFIEFHKLQCITDIKIVIKYIM